jgi:hypothetical protein
VRKRGTDDRCVMKLSRPTIWVAVSRTVSCGVCGAFEFVQLNLLTMALPGAARAETDGRLLRNCLKVGGGGRAESVRSRGGSG